MHEGRSSSKHSFKRPILKARTCAMPTSLMLIYARHTFRMPTCAAQFLPVPISVEHPSRAVLEMSIPHGTTHRWENSCKRQHLREQRMVLRKSTLMSLTCTNT